MLKVILSKVDVLYIRTLLKKERENISFRLHIILILHLKSK